MLAFFNLIRVDTKGLGMERKVVCLVMFFNEWGIVTWRLAVTSTRREEGVLTDWHAPQRSKVFFTNIWEGNGREVKCTKEYLKTIS